MPPTMVTAGYTADGLDLGRVIIQRDCKGHERWNYDIWGGTAVTEPLKLETIEEVMPGRCGPVGTPGGRRGSMARAAGPSGR